MIDIQNINGYGIQDPGFALLREVAQKYCPEELQAERQTVLPDETLNLTELETAFNALLAGGSGYGELLYIGDVDAHTSSLPKDDGFGIGIPETQKLRDLHYEEADTLNSEPPPARRSSSYVVPPRASTSWRRPTDASS